MRRGNTVAENIEVDGCGITIRLMEHDYIMADAEPPGVTVEVECRTSSMECKVWPNPLYVACFCRLTETYGAAAVMAWQGKSVIGFLPFRPKGCGLSLPGCVCYGGEEGDIEMVESASLVPQTDLSPKVLETHCIAVAPQLRRKGLGSAMVRYLVGWARSNDWQRIEGWAFADGGHTWLPDIAFWEKNEFTRGIARPWDESITAPGLEYHMDL